MASETRHYFPWRAVWKGSSITTPCRIVVDPLTSGLNNFLAKGVNTLQNLQQLMLDFRMWPHVAAFDIQKMYNNLHIEEEDLCFMLFLWVDNLDPTGKIKLMVFTRAMYGVVSSGNQAETSIRRAATHYMSKYPLGAQMILSHIYVDDGLPVAWTKEVLLLILYQIALILCACGFIVKCTTIVGADELSDKASTDGESIGVCGMRWYPHTDRLALAEGEMNFNRKVRGAKRPNKHKVESGVRRGIGSPKVCLKQVAVNPRGFGSM